jgi:hypothetical protein
MIRTENCFLPTLTELYGNVRFNKFREEYKYRVQVNRRQEVRAISLKHFFEWFEMLKFAARGRRDFRRIWYPMQIKKS